jgi:hypothetical protein
MNTTTKDPAKEFYTTVLSRTGYILKNAGDAITEGYELANDSGIVNVELATNKFKKDSEATGRYFDSLSTVVEKGTVVEQTAEAAIERINDFMGKFDKYQKFINGEITYDDFSIGKKTDGKSLKERMAEIEKSNPDYNKKDQPEKELDLPDLGDKPKEVDKNLLDICIGKEKDFTNTVYDGHEKLRWLFYGDEPDKLLMPKINWPGLSVKEKIYRTRYDLDYLNTATDYLIRELNSLSENVCEIGDDGSEKIAKNLIMGIKREISTLEVNYNALQKHLLDYNVLDVLDTSDFDEVDIRYFEEDGYTLLERKNEIGHDTKENKQIQISNESRDELFGIFKTYSTAIDDVFGLLRDIKKACVEGGLRQKGHSILEEGEFIDKQKIEETVFYHGGDMSLAHKIGQKYGPKSVVD